MNIICPHCNFSKTVDPSKVPDRPVRVNCPRCSKGFTFDKALSPVPTADTRQEAATAEQQVICPACGLVQNNNQHCIGCGVVFSKLLARWQENGHMLRSSEIVDINLAELRRKAENPSPLHQPKAGFWIRTIASILDFFLLGAVQLVLSLLIDQVIGLLGIVSEGDPAVNLVLWLFGASLSIGYAIFFIGYCGQTPGKMALRIKVIRTDGSSLSYGRAFLREVPGKFISSILLGIGYLMVAFDGEKQGLHDKIADTYVIKL